MKSYPRTANVEAGICVELTAGLAVDMAVQAARRIAGCMLLIGSLVLATAAQGQASPPTKQVIQGAQQQLRSLGYDAGTADSSIGPKTVAATKKFQSDRGLAITGVFDRNTLEALSVARTKPVPAKQKDFTSELAQIVTGVGSQDEYKSLDLSSLVKMFDENHDIDSLSPLERQAVLDVLLQRVNLTRKSQYKFSGVTVSESGPNYLAESKTGLTSHGTSKGETPDGHPYEFDYNGVIVMGDGHMLAIGTGQTMTAAAAITKHALSGGRGSLTIASAGNGLWLLSTEMPRDRIVAGPIGMGMGDVMFPIGDGTIYGIRGEIKSFLPGVTITTRDGKTAYFALISDYGVAYLAGEATVSSEDRPNEMIALPAR